MAYEVWYDSTEIADRIRHCAKLKHISTKKLLGSCDLGINTISKIANGSDINSKNLAKIADCLECSVDYLLGRTDNPELHEIGWHVMTEIQVTHKNTDTKEDPSHQLGKEKSSKKLIARQYFDMPASAGTGEWLGDDSSYSIINVPLTDESRRADFIIRVAGDSMEPIFCAGDKLLILKTKTLDVGDIGVFVLNGESYVKKLGNSKLISINPAYSDIPYDKNDTIFIAGKVIGKVEE